MRSAGALRQEISVRNQQIAIATGSLHELTPGAVPSVIFGCDQRQQHGNFHPTSYRNISANPEWARRLKKVHTASRRTRRADSWRWRELDCANSSDALLMNIFCYHRSLQSQALAALLGTDTGLRPEFGIRARVPLLGGKSDRTEIDLRLGNLLVEAKLTETNFQTAPRSMVERYRDFNDVFDSACLIGDSGKVPSYQLVRGVLAAHATGSSYCVLCDARRSDLIEYWYSVIGAVRDCALRCRLKLLAWQELKPALPKTLQKFLAVKYGI
jgi:hypothetical protein